MKPKRKKLTMKEIEKKIEEEALKILKLQEKRK